MTTPHLSGGKELPRGTRLEEFVIERVLGSGGFGITYLARDVSLNRPVVIKENLPSQFAHRDTTSLTVHPGPGREDQENFQWSLDNFSREAEMLASLHHPGIVSVLRRFAAFGTAYFVMPFVEGMPFDQLIEERLSANKPFTQKELQGLLERVLDALAHLHLRGIYHRDIKPGNILITSDGIPVLIDFGSARQRLGERSMTVVESPGYTPFEQHESRGNVGPWSDLYALGATLEKAITGQAPPKAMDRMRRDPRVRLTERSEFIARYSAAFLASIDKALEVDEKERWQDADQWLAALRDNTGVPRPRAATPRKAPDSAPPIASRRATRSEKKTNHLPWLVAACLVLCLIAVAKSISRDQAEAAAQAKAAEQRAIEQEQERMALIAEAKAKEKDEANEAERQIDELAERLGQQRQARIAQEKARQEAEAKAIREELSLTGIKAGEEREFEIAAGVKMTFCWIPPGKFTMGSPPYELGRDDDEKQVRVSITKGFWLAKTEVTQTQWRAGGGVDVSGRPPVILDGKVLFTWEEVSEVYSAANFKGDALPVERVDWNEVRDWCVGVTERLRNDGQLVEKWKLTLPTEAQWEYACRAGQTGPYSGGSLDEVAWYNQNSGKRTHAVGMKKANAWGLHDMHGNVREWCADWHDDKLPGGIDPDGASSGGQRVIRGGSWSFAPAICRAAYRGGLKPDRVNISLGFRPALVPSE